MPYMVKIFNEFLLFTYKEGINTFSIQYILNDETMYKLDTICKIANKLRLDVTTVEEILTDNIDVKYNKSRQRKFG